MSGVRFISALLTFAGLKDLCGVVPAVRGVVQRPMSLLFFNLTWSRVIVCLVVPLC